MIKSVLKYSAADARAHDPNSVRNHGPAPARQATLKKRARTTKIPRPNWLLIPLPMCRGLRACSRSQSNGIASSGCNSPRRTKGAFIKRYTGVRRPLSSCRFRLHVTATLSAQAIPQIGPRHFDDRTRTENLSTEHEGQYRLSADIRRLLRLGRWAAPLETATGPRAAIKAHRRLPRQSE